MATLEEIMGLYGTLGAPGAEDELQRRRRGPAAGGYEGIGGAAVTPGMLLPYLTGRPVYDYSGPMARDFAPGGRGLASLLAQAGEAGMAGNRFQGPAGRHFMNQGFDFLPPGQDQREAPGGPNIAPGNIDDALALDQPQGNLTPGVPRGVGLQTAPGQVKARPVPHTQGWRNVAPGYSAAAQFGYGTDSFERNLGLRPPGQIDRVGPAASSGDVRPVANIRELHAGQLAAGGGGGGGAGPRSQNPIGGGGGPVKPAAGAGAGQGTSGGGGGGKQVSQAVEKQAASQGTARGGTKGTKPGDTVGIVKGSTGSNPPGVNKQGEFSKKKFKKDANKIKANDPSQNFGNTIQVVPNAGNNNTPSETNYINPPKAGKTKPKPKPSTGSSGSSKQQR